MKKQIVGASVLVAALAVYTLYNSENLTNERDNFVTNCKTNNGIYAEGVLTDKDWEGEKEGEGRYVMKFVRNDLVEPTRATLPGNRKDLDAAHRKLLKGKSYSVCMKQDHVLIDYYKSF